MTDKKLKGYKFDRSKYIVLNDGLRRINEKDIKLSMKEDANLYVKELKEALKKQQWLEVIKAAIELQAIDDAKFYIFKKDYNS